MKPQTIGYAVNIGEHAWYQRLVTAFAQTAGADSCDLVTLDAHGEADAQAAQIGQLLDDGVSVLALSAVAPQELGEVLARCDRAGVPVVTESIRVSGPVTSHLGIDEYGTGVRLGRRVGQELPVRPVLRLVSAGFPPYLEGANREAGFLAGLRCSQESVEALFVQGGGTSATAARNLTAALARRPGWRPDVVFGVDDEMLLGSLETLGSDGGEPVVTATYGISPPSGPSLLDAGRISFGAAMLPELHGILLGRMCAAAARNQPLPRLVQPDAAIVTRSGHPEGWDQYYQFIGGQHHLDTAAAAALLSPADRALLEGERDA